MKNIIQSLALLRRALIEGGVVYMGALRGREGANGDRSRTKIKVVKTKMFEP